MTLVFCVLLISHMVGRNEDTGKLQIKIQIFNGSDHLLTHDHHVGRHQQETESACAHTKRVVPHSTA